ncbi:MAG: FtsQ-type POTRA domain-containing protein, partial [Melioribacteraceae bacterium]|nr:FtsQ-type POTRA domain-containing protein [Melioribacteraceae bacterium]
MDEKEQTKINLIEIEGNIHLPKDQYYKFANLEDYSGYLNLTPAIVKDRLEKHPYIERIDLV